MKSVPYRNANTLYLHWDVSNQGEGCSGVVGPIELILRTKYKIACVIYDIFFFWILRWRHFFHSLQKTNIQLIYKNLFMIWQHSFCTEWFLEYKMIVSSPELKTQVSFSDHLSSVLRLSVCKLFTFSSSSQEPLCQFQPNLAQSSLGWWGF